MPSKHQQPGFESTELYEIPRALARLMVLPRSNAIAFYDELSPVSYQSRGSNKSKYENQSAKLMQALKQTHQEVCPLPFHAFGAGEAFTATPAAFFERELDRAKDAEVTNQSLFMLKVLFCLGKTDPEKDVDNMAKWFMDCWKEVTGIDDAAIGDIRVMKHRFTSRDEGAVGYGFGMSKVSLSPAPSSDSDNQQTEAKMIQAYHLAKKTGSPSLKELIERANTLHGEVKFGWE